MIKIIFSDIDWTLFDHSKHPSKFDVPSIRMLKRLQKKGAIVFLCTARPYHSVKQTKILDLIKPDGLIAANGGIIFYRNEIIYRDKIDAKDFEKLCEVALKYKSNVEGVRPYDAFIINDNYDDMSKLFETYPEEVPPIEDYHHQDVIGANLFVKEEYDELIKNECPFLKYYYRYHPHGVDIANVIHDKGVAVKMVLDHLGLKKEEAIAYGDDLQDISMFKEVEHSFAMGNAIINCQKEAKYITKSVQDHGVKAALEQLNIDTNN